MSYESFYGGRQGASFVIVERFEGINIPNPEFKEVYYAANEDNIRFYPFILKKEDNYYSYKWIETTLDGSNVNVIYTETGQPGQEDLPVEYQKGMIQCFKQGGDTTDIVNYGEYVIIDTVSKDNPDNGKVFRRGMDFDNDLGGAEYIGQIVGPKGDSAELSMTYYNDVTNPRGSGKYSPTEEDPGLVPGMKKNGDLITFNDAIKYAWKPLRDKYGNITYYQIGFEIPYLVQDFIARTRSAYKENGEPIDDSDELITRIDDKEHPFYSKWKIDVPKGIKGESISKITTLPIDIKRNDIKVYTDISLTSAAAISISKISLITGPIVDSQKASKTISDGYVEITDTEGTTYYVKKEDCVDYHFISKNINYDNYIDGEEVFAEIGGYRVLKNVSINTGDQGNQKIHVEYEGGNQGQLLEEDIGNPINYIVETVVVNKSDFPSESDEPDYHGIPWGTLLVYYSDPEMRKGEDSRTFKGKPGWKPLGNVLKPGGIQSIANYTSAAFVTIKENRTPPEDIIPYVEQDPNSYCYKGWVVTVGKDDSKKDYYAYDYTKDPDDPDERRKGWYYVGTIDSTTVNPENVIDIDKRTSLAEKGIMLQSIVRKTAY